MQNLIKETGLTNKEFAEYYGIPYNTVLQWSKGIRKAPEYLKKLIKESRDLKTNGIQIPITTKKLYCIEYKTIYGERTQYYATDTEYNRNQQYKCFFEGQEHNYIYFQKFEINY